MAAADVHISPKSGGKTKIQLQKLEGKLNHRLIPRGYPRCILLISVKDKYLCVICELLLRVPVQSYCGHRFCSECLVFFTTKNGGKPCPACVKENAESEYSDLKSIFPDNALRKEMDKLGVKCYTHPKCSWQGVLAKYSSHMAQCSFAYIVCECGIKVFCEDIKVHKETECKHGKVGCKYGCSQLIEREMIENHNKGDIVLHLDMVSKQVVTIEEKLGQTNISGNGDIVSGLEKRLDNVDKLIRTQTVAVEQRAPPSASSETSDQTQQGKEPKISKLSNNISDIEGSLCRLQSGINQGQHLLSDQEKSQNSERAFYETLQKTLRSLERSMALKDVAILEQNTRIEAIEQTTYDGTFIWQVKGWSKLLREARSGQTTSIYSAPFYSSRDGHKFRGRLYPNGDGMGKGTHLSVFFVVLRSQFDAILKWPLRAKVTFTLLDLTHSNKNVVEAFRTDPSSSSFKQPTSDMNIASGCPMFASLDMLEGSSKYNKDDELFVKIKVELQA